MGSPVIAQLGALVFEVVGPLSGVELRQEHTYAEHQVVEGRPRLQYIGPGLPELNLTLVFALPLSEPDIALRQLRELALPPAGQEPEEDRRPRAFPLVFASGEVWGPYVVREMDETVAATDERGRRTRSEVRVRLTEWAAEEDVVGGGAGAGNGGEAAAERQQGRIQTEGAASPRPPAQPVAPPAASYRDVPVSSITRRG